MLRSVLKLVLILVVAILVYNYFFGTSEEKAQSKEIFGEVKDLGKAAWGLLRSEKAKFDEGKYDEAVDKVGGLIKNLRGRAQDLEDSDLLNKIDRLEKQRRDLERKIQNAPPETYSPTEKQDLKRQWEDLMRETEEVMKELDQK